MQARKIAIDAFSRAVRVLGSQSALARICGCTPGNINQLMSRGRVLPSEYVLPVEAATGVSRHELRPDIYPREAMVDQAAGLRFVGLDHRASSRADRLALGERYARGR